MRSHDALSLSLVSCRKGVAEHYEVAAAKQVPDTTAPEAIDADGQVIYSRQTKHYTMLRDYTLTRTCVFCVSIAYPVSAALDTYGDQSGGPLGVLGPTQDLTSLKLPKLKR